MKFQSKNIKFGICCGPHILTSLWPLTTQLKFDGLALRLNGFALKIHVLALKLNGFALKTKFMV